MSDDESPWIDMDGNINEMSPENKSPTTYSRPNTPEIDKLKSLAITPSSSLDSMSKPTVETKFDDKLEEYYTLKEEYDQQLRDAHTMWNNAKPRMSLEKKRENYQNFMMNRKCINCEKGQEELFFLKWELDGVGKSQPYVVVKINVT